MVHAMSGPAASIACSPAALERWYSDGPLASAPSALMCTRRATPAVRQAVTIFCGSSTWARAKSGPKGVPGREVQHADGVDHRVRVLEQARERGGVVHVGLDDLGIGQQQHVTGAAATAGGDQHLDACFAQAVGDGAADKAGAADDDDTFRIHAWTLGR